MRAALVLATALAAVAPASAATRYVSPMGDDAGPGDSARPWRSFGRSTAALKPGDTLVVLPGEYRDTLTLAVSGAPGRPVRISGRGRPRIVGYANGIAISGAWLEVTGLDARATGEGSAVQLKGAHHVRVADVWAHDSACAGIGAVGTDHLLIEGSRVWGDARRSPWQCSGISIYQPVAVDAAPGFHNVIRRNRVWDTLNVVVDDAVSHANGHTTDGNGIIVDDFEHSQSPGVPYRHGTLVEGNTLFDNGGRGVHVFKSRNVVVVGNVAYHNLKDRNLQRPAAEISAVQSAGVTVLDNIAVPRGGDPAMMDGYAEGPDLWDANLAFGPQSWSAPRSAAKPGPRTITGRDPRFVRPGVDPKAADFTLAPDSPARRSGLAVRLDGPQLVASVPAAPSDMGPGFTRAR